jgi:hypothetical protein
MLWVPAYSSSHFTDSLIGSDCSPRSDRGSLTRVTFGHRHRAHHATLLRSRAETKAAALPTPPTPAKPLQKPAEKAPSPAPTIPAPKAQPPEAQPPKTPAAPKAPTAAPDAPATHHAARTAATARREDPAGRGADTTKPGTTDTGTSNTRATEAASAEK